MTCCISCAFKRDISKGFHSTLDVPKVTISNAKSLVVPGPSDDLLREEEDTDGMVNLLSSEEMGASSRLKKNMMLASGLHYTNPDVNFNVKFSGALIVPACTLIIQPQACNCCLYKYARTAFDGTTLDCDVYTWL